jgi:hypothetical protein
MLNSLGYRSWPSRRLELRSLNWLGWGGLRDMSRVHGLVNKLMRQVCLMRRLMLLARSCRLRL